MYSESKSATSAPTARNTVSRRLVNGLFVTSELRLLLEHPRANVTLKSLDVTNTMYSGHVLFQIALFCELPAANLALVSGVRMLWSRWPAALSMRCVVVSADR